MSENHWQVTLSTGDARAVTAAAAVEDTRYYLNGIYLDPRPEVEGTDDITVVATDGHVMFTLQVQRQHVAGTLPEKGVIVPRAMLPTRGVKDNVVLSAPVVPDGSEYDLEALWADGTIRRDRAIDGKFPDWRRVIAEAKDGEDVRRVKEWGLSVPVMKQTARICELLLGPHSTGVVWQPLQAMPDGRSGMMHLSFVRGGGPIANGYVMPCRPR